jgi:hypothetical protein
MRIFCIAGLMLGLAATTAAQAPVTYVIDVVSASAANPLTALPVPNGTLTVTYNPANGNQPPFTTPPPAVTVNPGRFTWSDPLDNTRQYITPNQAAFFAGLPAAGTATVGAYVFRVTAISGTQKLMSQVVSNDFSMIPVVVNPPTLASFTPTSAAEGSALTLTGTNFTGATVVAFNGITASSFTVLSPTSITAIVPPGATSGSISVTTPGGTATRAGFTDIVALAPPSGLQVRP